MKLEDSRRLTGPNLYSAKPGAVVQLVFSESDDPTAVERAWRMSVVHACERLGWPAPVLHARHFQGPDGARGAAFMLEGELDRLFTSTEVNEWALGQAGLDPADAPDPLPSDLSALQAAAAEERARLGGLVRVVNEARARGVPWMLDDERLTLGRGRSSCGYEPARLPPSEAIPWSGLLTIPTVAITGTNGKTTCSRIVAAMARAAGHVGVGATSTDGIFVDGRLVDAGDWAGAGGTREVLRRADVSFAVLETARGGLLRRGMGVERCDAVLVTNVDRDHMGDYGVHDLETMAAVKGILTRAVNPRGAVVLGVDSPALHDWAAGRALEGRLIWFGLDPSHPTLVEHLRGGGEAWTVESETLVRRVGERVETVVATRELAFALGGAARFQVANALGAAALAHAAGVGIDAIATALRQFGASPEDNPGRLQVWSVPARVEDETVSIPLVIDFAHNEAGISAVAELLGPRRHDAVVCFGMAGDRDDEALESLGRALRAFEARAVVLREQPGYLRGRAPGEIPARLEAGMRREADALGAGVPCDSEVESLERAVALAGREGCVALLIHVERGPVAAWLERRGARRCKGDEAWAWLRRG